MGTALRIIFLTLPFFLVSGLIALLTFHFRYQRRMKMFQSVAAKYSAQLDSQWLQPRLAFPYFERMVTLTHRRLRRPAQVWGAVCQVKFGQKVPGFQVLPRRLEGSQRRIRGFQFFVTDDQDFDTEYVCQAQDVTLGRQVISGGARRLLRDLQSRFPETPVGLVFRKRTLTIFRGGTITREEEAHDFLRLALKLVDALLWDQVAGVEFVAEPRVAVKGDNLCPICSESASGQIVICLSCRTPHCRECWEYNGKCGMFACGETRFQLPDAARTVAAESEPST